MQAVSSLVEQFGPWLWFALAVFLFIMESIVPGVHFVWFGLSALIVGVIGLTTSFGWQWQLIAFALIALAAVFWVRQKSREESAKPDVPDLNVRGAQYIGRLVTIEDAIVNGRGKVRVGDTVWVAEGEDGPKGASVRVTGVDGTVLVVSRA
ncbi:MAG: NfeD family protein [Hyphomicrobium sp.]|uniref:NfeD family protein n=1 Tax=Hyphomicrobium sp. TaxID=82 RepID=UPI0039E7103C